MEPRESVDRSSSETPHPAAASLNGGGQINGAVPPPASGQIPPSSYPVKPASENSPAVDSVLQSDVRLLTPCPCLA